MKKKSVLVYGEYSGYGKSLVKGFRELGYSAEVLSFSGDGFKKINSGITLKGNNKISKLINIIRLIPSILKYKNILITNPDFFSFRFLGPIILLLLKITNKNIILLCCGDDVEFIKQGLNGNLENWPYSDIPLPNKKYFSRKRDVFINYLVAFSAKKIVPVMYDYKKAWSLSKFAYKLTETIPLACDGEVINIKNNVKEKIVIMHGINREDFKGSNIIKKALSEIEKKYKHNVEIILPKHLPLYKYLEIMNSVDISIDQTKGNSYGMNAIYSMLSGHVVLAPANNYFKNDLQITECPIVSINNSKESIVNALNELIRKKENLFELKTYSQNFAINLHSCKSVAKKFDKYLK
ncbi:hypothetical protein AB7W63_14650 [Providencia rettgeri]